MTIKLTEEARKAFQEQGRLGGKKGAALSTKKQRQERAKRASAARWKRYREQRITLERA